jgi:CubicO group peptidase (beta-lactamase class C family)
MLSSVCPVVFCGCIVGSPDPGAEMGGPRVGQAQQAILSPVQTGPQAYSGVFQQVQPGIVTQTALSVPDTTFLAVPNGTRLLMQGQGYYLTNVDIQVVNGARNFNAVFQSGVLPTQIVDALDWSDFQAQVLSLAATGNCLINLRSYVLNGATFYTGIFQPGSSPQDLPGPMSYLALAAQNGTYASSGYYLTNVDVSMNAGAEQYVGVWTQHTPGSQSSAFWVGDWNGFAKELFDEAALGRRLVDLRTWETGTTGVRRYAGVWLNGSGSYDVVGATTPTVFGQKITTQGVAGNAPIRINFENGYMPPPGLASAFHDRLDADVAGYGYAISEAGFTTAMGGFGYARAPWETTNPSLVMSASSRLDVGSVTKTVTATAIYKLLESPAIQNQGITVNSLLVPILENAGWSLGTIGAGVGSITLFDLLNMTSGLNEGGANGVTNCDANFPSTGGNYVPAVTCLLQQATLSSISCTSATPPVCTGTQAPPPSSYYYSDAAYLVLRAVVEALSGETYETYLSNTIFVPLGINDASLGVTALTNVNCNPALPPPYSEPLYYPSDAYQTNTLGVDSLPRANLLFECGNGALQFTASQMNTFVWGLTQNQLLTSTDMNTLLGLNMFGPAVTIKGPASAKNGGYAISGAAGPSAAIVMVPSTNTQISVLTNTGGNNAEGMPTDPQGASLDGFTRMYSYPTGTYTMKSASSGLCASMQNDSTADNALFVQTPCETPSASDQRLVQRNTGNGHFMLELLSSGKCLTVEFASQSDNAYIIQYDCVGGTNQTFTAQTTSDGNSNIVNDNSGMCVTVAGNSMASGAGLIQYACIPGALNEEWTLGSPDGTLTYSSGMPYQMQVASTSMCAMISGDSDSDNDLVVQSPCLTPAVSDQQFVWQDTGGGHFTLEALNSGKCLTVEFASQSDNAYIIQYDCLGETNQTFTLQSTDDGRTNIVNDNSGMCVTVAGNSMTSGAGLIQYACVPGALNQEWTL